MKITAIEAARKAGDHARERFFKQHKIGLKTSHDLVTEVDVHNEKTITAMIREAFPEHAILGEETGLKRGSDYTWIIDPLDGTTNYSIHNPFFDISIGVAKGNEPVIAVVYAPMTDEMFVAEKGKGAYLNGKRTHVSPESMTNSLLTYCHTSTNKEIKRIIEIFAKLKPLARDFNRMRAGALELAFVAAGRVGAYISNGAKSWDVAAGTLLVREAGGMVTDFSGTEWNLESSDIIASNGKIHQKLVHLLRDV
jgi:myo-inositol-1(or 4)-monophosphatase